MTLTCHRCDHPFTGEVYARRTELGWEHVVCPRAETCAHDGCIRPSRARGYCHAHYKRMLAGRDMDGRVQLTTDHLEDVEWMAETGESFDRAAERLGVKPASLERFLQRRGRRDLIAALKRREVGAA